MAASITVLLVALAIVVPGTAFPTYWGQSVGDGCVLPDVGYGNHLDPVYDSSLETSIAMFDSEGALALSFVAGETYTMRVTFPGDEPSRSLIIASSGEMKATGLSWEDSNSETICMGKRRTRLTINSLQTQFEFSWTAEDFNDVAFQMARTWASTEPYYVSGFVFINAHYGAARAASQT